MYMQRVVIHPELGKVREMHQHLEAWVKRSQGEGNKVGLAMQMFGHEGAAFVITVRLNDLAELERLQQRMRTDTAALEFLAKLATLSRVPPRLELMETLVPLPS